jgi:hypothetical protein
LAGSLSESCQGNCIVFRHVKTILVLALAALLSVSCARHKSGATAAQPTTQTIAPAEGQPAPNGSDTMTQTVEVDDSRSEADGMTGTVSASAPKATTKAPAKKKGKK